MDYYYFVYVAMESQMTYLDEIKQRLENVTSAPLFTVRGSNEIVEFVGHAYQDIERLVQLLESLERECVLLRSACDQAWGCEEAGGIPNVDLDAADSLRKAREALALGEKIKRGEK